MPRYSSEAIILHTTDFLESDKIVHALTREQGLISAIAKGAHRSKMRFPGTLEPFCEVTLEVHQGRSSDLQRIESAMRTWGYVRTSRLLDTHQCFWRWLRRISGLMIHRLSPMNAYARPFRSWIPAGSGFPSGVSPW